MSRVATGLLVAPSPAGMKKREDGEGFELHNGVPMKGDDEGRRTEGDLPGEGVKKRGVSLGTGVTLGSPGGEQVAEIKPVGEEVKESKCS